MEGREWGLTCICKWGYSQPTNQQMTTFMCNNDFINIIKSYKRFKISTGTCIHLILTNNT